MDKKQLTIKRVIGIVSFIIFLLLSGFIAWFLFKYFDFRNPEAFRSQIESYGWAAWLIALGIQILQVVIAFIPGEAVEIGVGYAFGAVGGTLICIAGVTIASVAVFLLTKKLGIKFVELFISREKIESLAFLGNENKLRKLIFILFFIPGTPKDLLTYVAGLTPIKLTEFLLISGVARLPSIVSSTVGGKYLAEKNYVAAGIVFAVTAVVSLTGLLVYNAITKKKNENNDGNSPENEKNRTNSDENENDAPTPNKDDNSQKHSDENEKNKP